MDAGIGKRERRLIGLFIFVMAAVLVALVFGMMVAQKKVAKQSEDDAVLIGQYDLQEIAENLNGFIHQGIDMLESKAFVIDNMLKDGAPAEEIQEYLARESLNYSEWVGSTDGGYFGYIGERFYHGVGWQPSAGYIPTRRPWYVEAARSRGRTVLSLPFASSRNLGSIISVNKRLSQKGDVLALGIPLANLNAIVSDGQKNASDIWFIMDRDGLVIGSSGEIRQGFNCRSSEAWGTEEEKLTGEVLMSVGTPFDFVYREKDVKVFSASIQDGWILVQMTDKNALFEKSQDNLVMYKVVFGCALLVLLLLVFMVLVCRLQVVRNVQGKSDFLDDVGFEIRTSINGILGMVRILYRDIRDEFQRDCVKGIELATRGILSVVDDMREVAKIERGNTDLDSSEYEVFSLLKDCFDAAAPKATAKNLHFSMECDPELPTSLWGDFARIRQIISNLISNAMSYTEVGEVKVSVGYDFIPNQTGSKLEEKISLKITVKDSGVGVRDKDNNEFFGPFDLGAVNQKLKGTSFGLGLTKRLVDMCGGDFIVKSRYGEGSTYMIALPQMVLNIEPMGDFALRYRKSTSMRGAEFEMIYAPSARILVVDDVEMNLKVIRGLLRDTRVQIDVAKNGSQCLSMVELKHYDLIFLDNLMPVMDGMETFERMKRLHNSPNSGTPVVLMTSVIISTDKESYLDAGFADFVQKPLKEEDLLRALKWYLPRHLVLTSEDRKESPNIALYSKMLESSDEKNMLVQKPVDLNAVENGPMIERQYIDDLELDMVSAPKPGESLHVLEEFLNVKSGMDYCINDETFYKEMLVEYVSANKYEDVCSALASGDWSNYQILVHGLKGTSLTIGADDLANELKSLEMACKEDRKEYVIENNGRVMKMYAILVEQIKKGLNVR